MAANDGRPAPFLIFQESDAVTRGLRDYFSDDVGECLIDQPEAFQKAQEYMQRFMPPDAQRKLKLYTDPVPLFTRYQIESQIESAYAHKVTLPSGGSLVIDHTEALVSIDINSARSTRGGDIEATARNTNLEAAEEIARQLRLRDIGGLIVIDFIDMESTANQRAVEDMLRDSVKMDRARIQLGRLSRFGLLELSRQRLRPALSETTHINCPRCGGMGTIRSVESMSLALLRLIGEEARKERTGRVIAQVPVDVATYLMNEKREQLNQIESRDKVSLVIVPNPHMQTPAYTLRRVRDDEKELPENSTVSYQLADQPSVDDSNIGNRDKKPPGDVPLVPSILPASTAPIVPMPVPAAAERRPRAHRSVRWSDFGAGCLAILPPALRPRRPLRPHNLNATGRSTATCATIAIAAAATGIEIAIAATATAIATFVVTVPAIRAATAAHAATIHATIAMNLSAAPPRAPGNLSAMPAASAASRLVKSSPAPGSGASRRTRRLARTRSSRRETDQAPRRTRHPARTSGPRSGNDAERSRNERGERSERGGRSRRRRGRGRRDGGENTANGAGANKPQARVPGNNFASA